MPIVAWYMLSKESYMKRVMSEVLPTAWWLVARFEAGAKEPGVEARTTLFSKKDQPEYLDQRRVVLDDNIGLT